MEITQKRSIMLGDWSLNTGRGAGATKREGEAREVLPLQKGGGGGKSFSHAEGGGTEGLGVVFYTVA